jgi:protein SCO1/2
MLALLVPIICYFIIKQAGDKHPLMPRHYIYDDIQIVNKKGKNVEDTIWHQLPNFTLTNQLGHKVSLDEIKGVTYNNAEADTSNKVIVANFFFTHCPTICPTMTQNMKRLQQGITNSQRVGDKTPAFIQFLSFSVDPERDSVPRLKAWADRFQIDPVNWWLLTGDKKTIYDLCINDMKLGLVDGEGVDTSFIHTDKFVLFDRNRNIRGYYSGLDSASLVKLSADIIFLSLEKDRTQKSFFAGKLQLMAIVFLICIMAVAVFVYLLKKKASPRPSPEGEGGGHSDKRK